MPLSAADAAATLARWQDEEAALRARMGAPGC